MRGECPDPVPWCKYAERGGCFSDTDHIVPRRLGTSALAATFIELQSNKQQLCRREHEEKTAQGDEPLPEREVMKQAIVRAHAMGEIALGRSKFKQIFGREWREYREQARALADEIQSAIIEPEGGTAA